MTHFTVILPTRNRPELFRAALESVLVQQDADFELIVMHDLSEPEHIPAYRAVFAQYADRLTLVETRYHQRGHGHAYGINAGVAAAANVEYLAFLDDDDLWIDPRHLNRVASAIAAEADAGRKPDMYLTNQEAWSQGRKLPGPIWIEDLLAKVPTLSQPTAQGCYRVTPDDLVKAWGFCHLNTLIVHIDLFKAIKGVDEYLRYECDRDFYYRAMDQAQCILYHPGFVARHNVPIVGKQANVSTQVSGTEKMIGQMMILSRLRLSVQSPAIRRYAWRYRAYTLQHLALLHAQKRLFATALPYAIEGVAVHPSPGWLRQTACIVVQAWLHGDRGARD